MSCNRIVYLNKVKGGEVHRNLTDKAFMKLIADGSLDPAAFTHEAHMRLAWLLMDSLGYEGSCDALCYLIARFDRQHGDGTRFSRRLTRAAACLIWECKSRSEAATFSGFMREHPGLMMELRELTALHKARGQ